MEKQHSFSSFIFLNITTTATQALFIIFLLEMQLSNLSPLL